jgi:hypothetical protein
MEDARPLDELTNDLATNHVLNNHALHSFWIHPIIQCCRAPRSRQRGKPATKRRRLVCDELAHQDIGALRAATKAALPHQICAIARVVGL